MSVTRLLGGWGRRMTPIVLISISTALCCPVSAATSVTTVTLPAGSGSGPDYSDTATISRETYPLKEKNAPVDLHELVTRFTNYAYGWTLHTTATVDPIFGLEKLYTRHLDDSVTGITGVIYMSTGRAPIMGGYYFTSPRVTITGDAHLQGPIGTTQRPVDTITLSSLSAQSIDSRAVRDGSIATWHVRDGSLTRRVIDDSQIQQRVTGACPANHYLYRIPARGTITPADCRPYPQTTSISLTNTNTNKKILLTGGPAQSSRRCDATNVINDGSHTYKYKAVRAPGVLSPESARGRIITTFANTATFVYDSDPSDWPDFTAANPSPVFETSCWVNNQREDVVTDTVQYYFDYTREYGPWRDVGGCSCGIACGTSSCNDGQQQTRDATCRRSDGKIVNNNLCPGTASTSQSTSCTEDAGDNCGSGYSCVNNSCKPDGGNNGGGNNGGGNGNSEVCSKQGADCKWAETSYNQGTEVTDTVCQGGYTGNQPDTSCDKHRESGTFTFTECTPVDNLGLITYEKTVSNGTVECKNKQGGDFTQ